MILMGPTGNLIKGHVLDCNQKAFDETLQFYDRFLYSKWNKTKFHGRGCWEIRRRPEFNTALDVCEFEGQLLFRVGPYENDLVHHVLDTQFLNYDILRYLKQQDTRQFGGGTAQEAAQKWQDERERQSRDAKELAAAHGMQLRKEASKSFKNEITAFKDYVKNGGNPHLIAAHWDHVKELE